VENSKNKNFIKIYKYRKIFKHITHVIETSN
jgi:hypothetical protein